MVAMRRVRRASRRRINLDMGSIMKSYSYSAMKLLFAWMLAGCAFGAHAASFDCAKAGTSVEKMICSDAETSALDGKLQQTYSTALAATNAYGRKALAKEQRNWIKYTRGICQDTACLREVYEDRIAVLARNEKYIEDGESHCVNPMLGEDRGGSQSCDYAMQVNRDPNDHVDQFNQSLIQPKISGKILGCSRLISIWSGGHIGPGRGVAVYGGYCVFHGDAGRKDVEICTDEDTSPLDANDENTYVDMRPVNLKDMSDKHLIDFTDKCDEGDSGAESNNPVSARERAFNEIKPFVPVGAKVVAMQVGDLKGDGQSGVLLVLNTPASASGKPGQEPRIVLLLVRGADGQLHKMAENDKLVPCAKCGGIAGDPFAFARVQRGSFEIATGGGSRERWSNFYTFTYSPARMAWVPSKVERGVVDTVTEKDRHITLTSKDLGSIDFMNIDPEKLPKVTLP